MKDRQSFKGSIVIGDPSYFVKSEEDCELCGYGSELEKIGFTDTLTVDFPDDPQTVVNTATKEILGWICQDSGTIAVVYKKELEAYDPDYEQAFCSIENRAVIDDFEGEAGYKTVNGDTVIYGNGNISVI